jgi:PIN domain nuclease of toxin-antitoxin system
MKIILDTHTFLWFVAGNPKLSAHARELIEMPDNQRLFSVASAWEIAIKLSLGKLTLTGQFKDLIPNQLYTNDITLLPIVTSHLSTVIELPFHHRDPFDRLIIAQAATENIPVITADRAFASYEIEQLW